MVEFTGERVVPGQVNANLWSEHLARYAFARRIVAGKRILDAGCGTGYGSAELSLDAAHVTGLDIDSGTIAASRRSYPGARLTFTAGSCEALPFRAEAFDAVVAFEVIEHLVGQREFLNEAARVLKPDGFLVISTPNKNYYTDSRGATGPNPYHTREFDPREFVEELSHVFPQVMLLVQNWVGAFAFYPAASTFWPTEARMDGSGGSLEDAHFLIAVCGRGKLPQRHSFVFVPCAANLLRERERHIQMLEGQLAEAREERDRLLAMFRKQTVELEEHNRWAAQLSRNLDESHARIAELQDELIQEQIGAQEVAAGYERQVGHLEAENRAKTQWALETEQRLTGELAERADELARCVKLLEESEATVVERTLWAQRTEASRAELESMVNQVRSSRWMRLGKRAGLGPKL